MLIQHSIKRVKSNCIRVDRTLRTLTQQCRNETAYLTARYYIMVLRKRYATTADDKTPFCSTDWFCENTRTTSPGTVTSPNYPSNYDANTDCTTLILAPEGISIHLNVTSIILQDSYEGSCSDSLTIYDGPDSNSPMLAKYCRKHDESYFYEVMSSSNSLFIDFQSDYVVQSSGFKASYKFMTGNTRLCNININLKLKRSPRFYFTESTETVNFYEAYKNDS